MSIDVNKNCVTMPDGTMYCWDRDTNDWYRLNKKNVALADVPAEAVKGIMLMMVNGDSEVA